MIIQGSNLSKIICDRCKIILEDNVNLENLKDICTDNLCTECQIAIKWKIQEDDTMNLNLNGH